MVLVVVLLASMASGTGLLQARILAVVVLVKHQQVILAAVRWEKDTS